MPVEPVHHIIGFVRHVANAVGVLVPAAVVAPVIALRAAPFDIARSNVFDLLLVADEVIAIDLVVAGAGRQVDAHAVANDQVVPHGVVFGVINEKTAPVAGNDVVFNHRVLNRAQHDAVVGVAPGFVVAHGQIAHFHQRQAAAIEVGLVVFPGAVVGVHVVRAITQVMNLVAPKQCIAGDIHINAVARVTDVVVDDLHIAGVEHLNAVAACRRRQITLAGDDVVHDARVLDAFQPHAEQVVGQRVVADPYPVRGGLDMNA